MNQNNYYKKREMNYVIYIMRAAAKLKRSLMLIALLTSISGLAIGQNYVFMRNSGTTYYYASGNTWSSSGSFSPDYIWTMDNNVPKNNDMYLIISQGGNWQAYTYTASLSNNSNATYTFTISNGNVVTTTQESSWSMWGGNSATYYLPYNLGTLSTSTGTNDRVKAYQVNTTTVTSISTNPTINGSNVLTTTGNTTYTATGAAYRIGYTNYNFNSADHYYDASGNSFTGTPANATLGTAVWDLTDNAYATVNSSGVINVSTLPANDITLTLTVTIPVSGGTPAAPAGTTLTATKQITIQGTTPSAPIISVSGTTVTLSTTAAGTTTIRYTINGNDPTANSGTEYNGTPFDIGSSATSPVIIRAVTVRNGNASSVSEQSVTLTLPEPVITADATAGTATISAMTGATIYYTTDGTTPTTSSTQYSGALSGLSPMTTIKAIAVKDGWNESPEASETLRIPSGADGSTVTLFDLEDHSWSYYSDVTCPIRSLSPVDVQIKYFGNGVVIKDNSEPATITDDNSSVWQTSEGAAVNIDAPENVFLYYKTLERTDGSTSNNPTGRCKYSLIPNPFQVRPTYSSTATRTIFFSYNKTNSGTGSFTITYINSSGNETTITQNISASGSRSIDIKAGTNFNYSLQCTGGNNNATTTLIVKLDNGNGTQLGSFTANRGAAAQTGVLNARVADDAWRGFYKWRVKTIDNGKIYSAASGNTEYGVGDLLDMEQTVYFMPATGYEESGMIVEFEAVWARAYVVRATNDNPTIGENNVGYERNFLVLDKSSTTFQYGNISNTNFAVTITPYFPDGSYNNRGSVGGADITLAANTKFENVQFSNMGNRTLTANSNDLIIGRGCTGSISTIRGVESNSYRPKHLRVESGTITNFYLGGQSVTYTSGTITAKATLGCDYDRAKDDHGKLSISSNIYGGTSFRNTAAANRSILSFDWTVKSGTFHNPNSVGYGGGGDEGIYLSSSGLQSTDYNGKHYIKIEGGHFASIAGGMDGGYAANDGEPTCKIRMTGGHIYGAIYGAAEFAGAVGDRLFIITGGEIDGWIAGGCNGTATTGGLLDGNTNIYFGGSASVGNQSGGTHVGQENFNNTTQNTRGDTGADGGNIFGAGCGILSRNTRSPYAVNTNWQTATVGNVNNSTIVVSDEAHVWRDVHGGGNYGWVADNGTTNILIAGNAIIGGNDGYGNVFGGSNNQQGQEVVITVKGGDVKGGVYGGSHSWGVINDNVTMNVSGGMVETGVFGGGYGTNQNSCDVTGTVDITMTGGTVLTGLYGGGNVNSKINGKTTVNVNGGTVGSRDANASVYGGGLGAATRAKSSVEVNVGSRTDCAVSGSAVIYGDVYGGSAKGITNCNDAGTQRTSGAVTDVTLNKGTINGSLYGGGHGIDNATANVWGPVTVKVYGGTLTGGVYGANNLSGAPQNSVTVDIYGTDAQPENGYAIANVYGGGNMAEYSKNNYPTVTVHNCNNSIGNVYGGGNAAKVQQTDVTIYGGNRIGAVYAGGNGTGVSQTFVMVTNNAVAKIYGGTIGRVFAGNNSSGIVNGSKTVTIDASTDETTNASNCITCGNSPMKIGAVFHGGNQAAGSAGTVNIVCTGASTNEYIDTLFGGANNADIVNNNLSTAANVTLNIDRGYIRSGIFGGNNAGGKVTGNIEINLKRNSAGTCAYNYPTVFGGGYGAGTSTGGNITVNIGEKTATNTAPTVVATIAGGAVYGGSALGSVNDASNETTTVNIYNGTISGNIYGGGLGEAGNATKGMVNGVVTVNIGASDQTDGNCASDLTACSVYGCNNTGGSPQGDVTVHVYRTGHSTTNERSYTVNDGVNGEPTYAIDQVFGGGNAADYNPAGDNKATVYIHGCDNTVRRVFGGGNAAAAKGVVTTIEGGRYDYVFGGGNGEDIAANIGSGGTDLAVSAGLIHHLFGGSNEQGIISGPMRVSVSNSGNCDEQIDEFFGGGNLANLGSDGNEITLNTTIECNTVFGDIYGGSNLADIYGTVTLTVNGGQISRVFAGSKGVASGDATYPSGKAANIYGNVKLNIYGGDIERAFGGSNINGNISGTIGVDLDWSMSNCSQKEIDYIYGASNDATYTPTAQAATGTNYSPTVKLINGTVGVNVYGGGKGSTAIVSASPKVIVGDATNASNKATVNGDVFGGGDAADVNGRTNVIVGHTSTVMGNVFGGGNAAAIKKVNGNYGNTLVILKDKARVYKNVYGGGNQGEIGGDTKVIVNSN